MRVAQPQRGHILLATALAWFCLQNAANAADMLKITFTVTNKSEREQGWQHRNDLVKQSKHSATKGGVTAKEDNVASKPDSAETKSASTEEDAAPLPKNETHTQTAILSANKIVVDGTALQVIDFDDKTWSIVDPNKKTYTQTSLFAAAAFREYEVLNREVLAKILVSAGARPALAIDAFDPLEVACELGLTKPNTEADSRVKLEQNGDSITLNFNNRAVASAKLSAQSVGSLQRAYGRYLAYTLNLHPAFRDKLVESDKFPSELECQWMVPGAKCSSKLELVKCEPVSDIYAIPNDYTRDFGVTPISRLQKKLLSSDHPIPPSSQSVQADATALLAQNHPLDAFLTIIEYALMTGDMNTAQDVTRGVVNDDDVIAFAGSMEPKTADDAKKAFNELERLRTVASKKGYLTDLFQANIANTYPELKAEPNKLFLKALQANPLLTGAYKDLGFWFCSHYQTDFGWDCFEMARLIAPSHPALAEVTAQEKRLQEFYPGFF